MNDHNIKIINTRAVGCASLVYYIRGVRLHWNFQTMQGNVVKEKFGLCTVYNDIGRHQLVWKVEKHVSQRRHVVHQITFG